MASARTTCELAVSAALVLVGYSGPRGAVMGDDVIDDGGIAGGRRDGGGDGGLTVPDGGLTVPDGGLTVPDGGTPPPTGVFPLGISADQGSLVAHDGSPFLL